MRRTITDLRYTRVPIPLVVAGGVLLGVLGIGNVSGTAGPAVGPDLIIIDPAAPITEHRPIPREALAPGSPIPQAGDHTLYSSPDHSVRVGVWETEPGTVLLDMRSAEYVHVIQGDSILRRADGKTWKVKAGDSFIVPKGFKGEAKQTSHFRKLYVEILSGSDR
jgi:uncharacterized cupin superfamily protein